MMMMMMMMCDGSVIPDPAVAQLFKKLPVFCGILEFIILYQQSLPVIWLKFFDKFKTVVNGWKSLLFALFLPTH